MAMKDLTELVLTTAVRIINPSIALWCSKLIPNNE